MSSPITIYHNPRCSTSRGALAAIEAAGHTPTVVNYLETGWTKTQLKGLLKRMGAKPIDILRAKEPLAAELGLKEASGEAILSAMVEHPILVERPIVETPKGVVLARPADKVGEVL